MTSAPAPTATGGASAAASAASPETTPESSAPFTSSTFGVDVSIDVPSGWQVQERPSSLSLFRGTGTEADLIGNRVLMIIPADYGVVDPDGRMPWPSDLHAWLQGRAEFEPDPPQPAVVGDSVGTQVDATAQWEPGSTPRDVQLLIAPAEVGAGGEESLHAGTFRWRFIEVEPVGQPSVVLVMWAPEAEFDAWTEDADEVIQLISFGD